MFREFYESKDHYARGSFPLVPNHDKSLLLINSGMAPMKPYFAGIETPPSKRMTTCQKCIRTGDIDIVGQTDRHGTFFEMMGSFSFGDYFKEESIKWGWEFITEVLEMPKDKVWATIYQDDDEAFHIWKDMIGMPEEHIVRLGKEDNFWEIGTGPCGPCSEIYFDRGPEFGCGKPDCKPGCECDRYIEFWNHVFTQFDRQEDGSYLPLAHPNIDTGMGLERLACLMQGVVSIFDVDTIRTILDEVVRISSVEYHDGKEKSDTSIRIITDHIRSITFMIADGVLPSNEGRGYVLRRLLRRAARHGRLLGIRKNFLAALSDKVIEVSGDAYPELFKKREYIKKIISAEEQKFSETIDQGSTILDESIAQLKKEGKNIIPGEQAFKLYDTFGFPLELTQEIASEAGIGVDVDSFNQNMLRQKEMARAARKSETDAGWSDESALYHSFPETVFSGYETLAGTAKVLGIFHQTEPVTSAKKGDSVRVVLDRTPFYGEGGGQSGDTGLLLGIPGSDFAAKVENTTKFHGVFVHHIELTEGTVAVGDTVQAQVDPQQRNKTARNHTATHLLHKALRTVLGDHVEQAGSSVTPQGLRFDFTHFESIPADALNKIESIVNEKILEFIPVESKEMPIEEAQKTGAISLFSEKYGNTVRVVSAGDYSKEFCGGIHVSNSGQIGAFKILSESGVAANVRRIEATTGTGILDRLNEYQEVVAATADILKTNPAGLAKKAEALFAELKTCKKELENLTLSAMGGELDAMISQAKEKNGVKLITKSFENSNIGDLRKLSDEIKAKTKSVIMVFAALNGEKGTLMVSVSDDLLDKGYHAGNMIKQIAAAAGGSGGGKADMAQAGAKDVSKLDEAFDVAYSLL